MTWRSEALKKLRGTSKPPAGYELFVTCKGRSYVVAPPGRAGGVQWWSVYSILKHVFLT